MRRIQSLRIPVAARPLRSIAPALLIALVVFLRVRGASAETPREEAARHYLAGTRLFNLTRYDAAIAEYEAAYRIKDDPSFLYNIAQAHRLAGRLDKAIPMYRNYLRLVPESSQRAAIEQRIAEMEKTLAAQVAEQKAQPQDADPRPVTRAAPQSNHAPAPQSNHAPAPPPGSDPAPAMELALSALRPAAQPILSVDAQEPGRPGRTRRTQKIAGFTLVGIGAAAIATGIAFEVMALKGQNEIFNEPFDPAKQDLVDRERIAGAVVLGVGGAAAIAGTVVAALGYRASARTASLPVVAPVVSRSGAGVVLRLAF